MTDKSKTLETTFTWISIEEFLPPIGLEVLVRYIFDYGDDSWIDDPIEDFGRGAIDESNCEMDISVPGYIWNIHRYSHNYLADHGIKKLKVTHWAKFPEFE